jgi:hypothetical protein
LTFDSIAWSVPLIIAAILAASMAWVSAFNVHPDEKDHARAADYYRTHWLPPKFDDPDAAPSYSRYGYSYLKRAGHCLPYRGQSGRHRCAAGWRFKFFISSFNLTLFAAILLTFLRKVEARHLLVPLALSAQIWYVFSYFNADAFALAVALFAAYQIAARGSFFNAALDSNTRLRWFGGVVLLGIGFGLLLLSKRNYYIFLAFLAAYVALREIGPRAALGLTLGMLVSLGWYFRVPFGVAWWLYGAEGLIAVALIIVDVRRHISETAFRRRIGTFIAAGTIGLALFLPRVAFDKLVVENPANSISTVQAAAEVYAADGFKPSQVANAVAESALRAQSAIHLRERGMSYLAMLSGDERWLGRSYISMVGVYGYFAISSSKQFYAAVAFAYLMFVVSLGYGAWRSRDAYARQSLAIAAAFGAMVILMSSLHSWTSDFQPQGRYLFPAFVMLGVAMKDNRARMPTAVMVAAALAFVLAVYSFCGTGLELIEKR